MLNTFFKREISRGLTAPMVYIFMFIIGFLVAAAVSSKNVVIGGVVGDVYKNAPSVVADYVAILNIFGVLFATAFFNNAALRDFKFNFNEIMFSTPIHKSSYFFGRFLGAWVLSCLVTLGIYFGFVIGGLLGVSAGWLEPEQIGPIPWMSFVTTFFIFTIPNMFVAGAIIFSLASKFRNTIVSFLGAMIIIIGYMSSLTYASDLDNEATAALIDVFGINTYSLETKYYTPFERNTLVPALTGYMITNRLLWTTIGLIILGIGYFSFNVKARTGVSKKKAKANNEVLPVLTAPTITTMEVPGVWTTFISFFKVSFNSIVKNYVFIILTAFAFLLTFSNLSSSFEGFGLKSYPVTYKMMDVIGDNAGLFVLIALVFFSGELIWRDRDAHINEVIDSTPHKALVALMARATALISAATILHCSLILAGILYQTTQGYYNYELGVYFTHFILTGLTTYVAYGLAFVAIQVFINNKYIGYFISVLLLFGVDMITSILEIKSKMVSFAATPYMLYSDMNGFGPNYTGSIWFSLYWVVFGILLLLLSGLFWARGRNTTIAQRWQAGRKMLSGTYYGIVGAVGVLWLGIAGFVYYNTQVLNTYKSQAEQELAQVNYEKRYKQYENIPKPKITDVVYYVDIYPSDRKVDIKADLALVNKSQEPIDSIHFTLQEDWNHQINIPNSKLVLNDTIGYQIYQLNQPLLPNDTVQIQVTGYYDAVGFENQASNTWVVKNGTFLNNTDIMPDLGYVSQYEISDKHKRKTNGLPKKESMPDLEETCSHSCMKNYISNGSSDWVNISTYISTSEDQIAIAPGSLISEKVENGRRKYYYKTDHIAVNFYSFISAKYKVAKRDWNGVSLEVYYHPAHEVNVEMMLDAIQKSLAYYTKNFGPYYHKQARIIEFPRYATFAQAFPGTMPYAESFGFIMDLEDEKDLNIIDAVIAHEMAHQYWAHQVIGAYMKGTTMLSESFAEYSSLMVMKEDSDDIKMKKFLKYDLNRYLRGRGRESEKELPLYEVGNQGHIHYGKGSFIMYALQDYVGEDSINLALRNFLDEYKYQEPPYPTTHDFLRHLEPKIPDSLSYLVQDWIKDITLYDLRLTEAKATQLDNGKYEVTVDLLTKKSKADSVGQAVDVPIADWVDIGFYKDNDEKELMFKERILLKTENSKLTFNLDTLPAKAAIDPLRLLIDRIYKDNVQKVDSE